MAPNERGRMKRDTERVSRITTALAAEGLDALLCALPANVLLLSGYWPVIGNALGLITRDGGVGVVAPEDELEYARESWADCIRTFRPASLERIDSAYEAVSGRLQEAGRGLQLNGEAKVGFEGGCSFDPSSYASMFVYGAAIKGLVSALGHVTPVDATETLDRLKSRLTDREIQLVRHACEIAARAFDTVAAQLRPGMIEMDTAALLRGGLLAPQRGDGFAYCMSGPNAAHAYAAYQRSTDRRLKEGDFVLVHCNSHCGGFWTDITRTFVLGAADAQKTEVTDAVLTAAKTAFSAVRPGARAAAVDAAARDVMAERGFAKEFKHATGHGVGFAAINHNARPRIHPASDETLQPGMIFNIEPAVYVDGNFGYRHCDMALVTPDGAECLTGF